jgi:hypothetical protein
MIKLRADVRCYMCGRIAGELSRLVGRVSQRAEFHHVGQSEPLPGSAWRGARCDSCGGGLFLDEVEKIYLISTRPLKPEKRGRKPKKRPALAVS